MLQKSFDLGRECEHISVPEIIERLFAQPVSCTEQPSRMFVPNGESKHAAEQFYTGSTEFLVSVEDSFCIAVRPVAVPGSFKPWPDCRVIEDLAVVNNPEAR